MGIRLVVVSTAGAVILSVSLAAQAPSSAPPVTRLGGNIRAKPVTGPVPRLADGKPDMSGLWLGGGANMDSGLAKGETLPLLPATRKLVEAEAASDDPQAHCLPIPPPRANPYPWRMVVTTTHVFFVNEMYGYRQVFMDGRPHPAEPDPTWYGHSIGHWDGDTLVVDTVGFNDKTWLDARNRHSDKLHLITRYTRTDLGTLEIEYTIDDPGAYARPFKVRGTARLMPGDEIIDYICEENNQDVPYLQVPKP